MTRARILQFRHQFPAALAELKAALDADAYQPDAWLQFASIQQVQGNLDAARAGCLKLVPIADPLIGAACVASTGSLSGRSAAADQLLTRALSQSSAADDGVRAWAWTTLAEIRARRGDVAGAEFAFLKAMELEPEDVYARAAYADLLLDAGRHVDARRVVGDATQADALLLRAAIAAQRNHDADAAALAANLSERFAEARARNDETHLREQARYLLEVAHDARAALALAQRNFAVQREPADARILLESALAAGDTDCRETGARLDGEDAHRCGRARPVVREALRRTRRNERRVEMDRTACDRDRRKPCGSAQAERQLSDGQRVVFEWRSRRPLGHRAARSGSRDRARRERRRCDHLGRVAPASAQIFDYAIARLDLRADGNACVVSAAMSSPTRTAMAAMRC